MSSWSMAVLTVSLLALRSVLGWLEKKEEEEEEEEEELKEKSR